MQINKDLTFKPKINEVSKRIDKEAVKNYENQNSVDFLLSQPASGYNSRPASTLTKIKDKSININATTNSVGFRNSTNN